MAIRGIFACWRAESAAAPPLTQPRSPGERSETRDHDARLAPDFAALIRAAASVHPGYGCCAQPMLRASLFRLRAAQRANRDWPHEHPVVLPHVLHLRH